MNAILEQINSAGEAFVDFALPMLTQSGILILILLLVDFLLRRKVRAVFRYWIWMLVLAKLVLPTSLASPLSLGYLFGDRLTSLHVTPITPVHPQLPSTITTPIIDLSNVPADTHTPPAAPVTLGTELIPAEAVPPPPVPPISLSWQGIVFLLWLAVVIAMGLLLLQRAIFVRGLVVQAADADSSIKETFDYCCERMGVRRKIRLKVSANATSPAVCGLFSQVVLLPHNLSANLSASQLWAVLLHELAHIRRYDLWVNLVQTILQILYFYNPLLWIANTIIRRIREQAVDEMVLVAMGENAQQYPETLVSVAKLTFKQPVLSLRLIGVVESKSALASRIKRILNRPIPKTTKLGIVGILA
ncbi:MAG: M56 family metallopeptidase, partial [Planctomycetota bacterium]|nr:M56 family metallopeptidase [Planctomycetota bacterium]